MACSPFKSLDFESSVPLHRQVRAVLRAFAADAGPPGTRIPSAAALAEMLGVNRLTVLKAVRHLVHAGELRTQPGKGVYTTGGRGGSARETASSAGWFEGIAEGPHEPAVNGGMDDSDAVLGRFVAESLDDRLISFAAGFPPKDLLPVDALRRSLSRVLTKSEGATHLGYAPTSGAPALTAEIERVLAARGLFLADDDILVVTEGAQQALSLCLEQFFESRGALAMESPGYMGIIAACRRRGIPMVPVAVDRGGMNPTAAARALGSPEVRGLYTVPTFQNPTGVTQHLMRRKRILSLANERGAILIEDDTYADLRLGGKPTVPIKALPGSERVIYVGSLSKSLAPGLRLGFLVANGALGQALLHLKETVDISTGMLSQAAAADFLSSGGYRRHLTAVKKAYRSRRSTMLAALERHLGDRVRIHPPKGGLHLYVMFARPVDMERLDRRCRAAGVLYAPAALFFSDGRRPSAFRLNFAAHPEAVIEEGIGRLAACIREVTDESFH